MVDKRSLRSSKRSDSDDTNKNPPKNDSSSTNEKPKRASSTRKSATAAAAKSKRTMPDDRKTAEDVEMKDTAGGSAQAPSNNPSKEEKAVDKDDDVEMAEGKVDSAGDGKDAEKKEDPTAVAVNEIKQNFALLERAVVLFDARFTLRVLRHLSSLRKRLSPEIIAKAVSETYPVDHPSARKLLETINQSNSRMEVDDAPDGKPPVSNDVLPEVDVYLHLLVQIYLLDKKSLEIGSTFSNELVEKVHTLNRRTLDSLAAKVYFYYARFHELLPSSRTNTVRARLLASLRTATLRKDVDTQATLITLILRNYLAASHIVQADQFVAKVTIPESAANNVIARYNYYVGKIHAIQLEYSTAHADLTAAIRKAPQTPTAAGFIQAANKLDIVVQLLMGDIPERKLFREKYLQKALHSYFELVRAVRTGELTAFMDTLKVHTETFKKDGTYSLILRLRQNVIKTGIRMMSLTYSRISLKDICIRLRLDSEESAEYIVSKAIRDGVIEATLNHEKGYMQSNEVGDVYATQTPKEQFDERIGFCMMLHNDSVKAMRFPMNQHRLELKNAQEARERERELAKEIQDGDIDDDDATGDFDGL